MALFVSVLISVAQAQMSPVLWRTGTVGASQSAVEKRLTEAGYAVTSVDWKEPGGLAAGTLGPPGLLALMNRYKVRNRLIDGLPEKGPSFVVVEHESAFAVYAFIRSKLWATAYGLTHTALKPSPDPFDSTRLNALTKTTQAIRSRCGSLSVKRRDSYGNAREWNAPCGGGMAYAHYEPASDIPFRILIVGAGG